MHWVKSAEFEENIDLAAVDKRLHAESIQHRFTLESGKQVLWLLSGDDRDQIVSQVIGWLERPETMEPLETVDVHRPKFKLLNKPAPLTVVLLFLSCLGAVAASINIEFVRPFGFWDQNIRLYEGDSIYRDILAGQYWRLVTPIFLHFGPMHIVFNGVWLWYLGSMIETTSGRSRLAALVFLIALLSNIAQATVTPILFGGMSGVIFGLLSYVWLGKRLSPSLSYRLPDALFYFMTAYMLLSAVGLFEWFGNINVADTAHIVGYISGMIAAVIVHLNNSTKQPT